MCILRLPGVKCKYRLTHVVKVIVKRHGQILFEYSFGNFEAQLCKITDHGNWFIVFGTRSSLHLTSLLISYLSDF